MAVHQLCRSEERCLELGEIRFALLPADALLLRWLGYGSCLGYWLFVVKQIVSVGRCGAVNSVIAVDCGIRVG